MQKDREEDNQIHREREREKRNRETEEAKRHTEKYRERESERLRDTVWREKLSPKILFKITFFSSA